MACHHADEICMSQWPAHAPTARVMVGVVLVALSLTSTRTHRQVTCDARTSSTVTALPQCLRPTANAEFKTESLGQPDERGPCAFTVQSRKRVLHALHLFLEFF